MNERDVALRRGLGELGFDEVRVAAVADYPDAGLRAWLQGGMHGDMAWMERTADKRLDPNLVLPGAKSVIMLGVNYWKDEVARKRMQPTWARYALHEDYHDTIKPALFTAGRLIETTYGAAASDYRYYVDTGPVLERGWAARSGLGFVGKNAMLISRRHGNWLFLAAILTTLPLAADEPIRKTVGKGLGTEVGLLCGKCTRCLDACPTQAFPRPGVVDARRCVSYQTIENRGVIPRELRAGIGHRIYGCDVCLEVCPWNRFARAGRGLLLAARHDLAEISLREILELTPVRYAEIFRRTAIKRLKFTGLLRNACVVAGNSGDHSLIDALMTLVRHESELVRAHAVWAVRQLGGEALLGEAKLSEVSAVVLAEYGD